MHGNVKCECGHRWSNHEKEDGQCEYPKMDICGCKEFRPNKRYARKMRIREALKRQLTLF